ncbi:hypothetical protein DPMN_008107 [Dreissena polymorpha]|uniref:RNA ligase 1 n=1 Tax=Dreissena polymorpha TaxID=45954 RepID=A0A9D4MVI0_DREPO|nr:hypothetical protein DPMN_008107 [Dreissena polymorpha]
MMEGLGAVQQKISCVFETAVIDEVSKKRDNQSYRVQATSKIKQKAIDNEVNSAQATEKLDGTCQPWLWARFDKKPNKSAERRFKKFQTLKQKNSTDQTFAWDLDKDFKETPEHWIPASGVEQEDGRPVPDDIGHTPGWVPVYPASRQHCWHLSAVDLKAGLAVVLREENEFTLCIECVHLSSLLGRTAELIGTNINGNPYGIGNKKFPVHLLVVHGTIQVLDPPQLTNEAVKSWFETAGQVEGIVWHCANGALFKVHRNHVGLDWPVPKPVLSTRPIRIAIETNDLKSDTCLLETLAKLDGQTFASLLDLERVFPSVLTELDHFGMKHCELTSE